MIGTWISKQPPGRIAKWATVFVIGLWSIYFIFVILGARLGWPQKLDGMGQSGDTFGSVNALFTGLALIGLVYTVFLQREEIQDNRKALQASRREQFLSARLNARTALLQAAAASAEHASTSFPGIERSFGRPTEIVSEALALEVLLAEIHLGISPEPWSLSVERTALAAYMASRVTEIVASFASEKEDVGTWDDRPMVLLRKFSSDFRMLKQRYSIPHPDVTEVVASGLREVNKIQTDSDERADELRKEIREASCYSELSTDERRGVKDTEIEATAPLHEECLQLVFLSLRSLEDRLRAFAPDVPRPGLGQP